VSRRVITPYKKRREAREREIGTFNRSLDALLAELRERQRMISVEARDRSFHRIDLSAPAHAIHGSVVYSLPNDAEQIVESAYSQVQHLWVRKAEREESAPNEQSFRDEAWLALTDREVAEREAALRAIRLALAVLSVSTKSHTTLIHRLRQWIRWRRRRAPRALPR
jgi:hypothetical protein